MLHDVSRRSLANGFETYLCMLLAIPEIAISFSVATGLDLS